MKFFPPSYRINQKSSNQPANPSQAGPEPGEPSDTKEILLLGSGLLTLILGIGGILMYTEENPQSATASQPTPSVELAKAFSSPVAQSDLSESPATESASPLALEMEASTASPELISTPLSVSPPSSTLVSFGFAQATLSEEDKSTLSAQVAHLPQEWDGTLRIQGHTDTRGPESYNRALGMKRAEAVKAYVVSLGVPQDRIHIDSFGKNAPLCQEDSPACHDQNRRAEIEWLSSPVAQGEEPMISMTSPAAMADNKLEAMADPTLSEAGESIPNNPAVQDSPILEETTSELVTTDVVAGPETQP